MTDDTPAAARYQGLTLEARCRLAYLEGCADGFREAHGTDPTGEDLARLVAGYAPWPPRDAILEDLEALNERARDELGGRQWAVLRGELASHPVLRITPGTYGAQVWTPCRSRTPFALEAVTLQDVPTRRPCRACARRA
jgi:hypothetical protein